MPITPGTRLGPYEIVAAIGAGGMGEVYHARDSRLDRSVAIKVLPALLAADPDARARFEREAKAIAALSHPNILAVHDFGFDNDRPFVVMELLEGMTLRERLSEGALPLNKAAQISRDVALGLAAAHDAGIVHRDIKPENIFVTTVGLVKILDFGLARAARQTVDDPNSPTFMRKTDAGVVMGTIGYMSPEQVKGATTDHRSDIFSLGCVLFEMVSGRRAFERPTAAETMTAVLREDPPELTRADGQVPAALDQIVRHCLEKDPAERFQSSRDLSFALQSIRGTTSSHDLRVQPEVARPARKLVLVSAAVVTIVAAAGLLAVRLRPEALPAAPQLQTFQQLTDRAGVETMPTLSPDGKTLVYMSTASGNADLYSLRVGGRTSVLLTPDSPDDDVEPAFSPDGERIAFRSTRDGGGIFIMNASGESVRRLTSSGFNPAWSPDGREIAIAPTGFAYPTDHPGTIGQGFVAIDVATARTRPISNATDALQPAWSPHGTRIAYWGLRGHTGQRDIWTIAADGSDTARGGTSVTDDAALDWNPVWSPDGGYLYFSSDRGGTMNLWRVAIDEDSGRVLHSPEPVTAPAAWCGDIAFSRDGSRMAFAAVDWRSTLLRVGFDASRESLTGTPSIVLKSTRPIRDHEVSPDGQWVVYNESSPQEDLLVARTNGSQYRRLTDDRFRDRGATWSPDGRRIAFYSDRSGSYESWTIHPDGSGLERVTSLSAVNFPVWSPDGGRLAVSGVGLTGAIIVDSHAPAVEKPAQPLVVPGGVFWPFSWSASNLLAGIVFGTDAASSGSSRLATYSMSTRQFHDVPNSLENGFQIPLWIGDGPKAIVRTESGISIVNMDTGARKALIAVRGYAIGRSVGVSRDSRWITYTETGTEGDIWLATLGRR
jgi:eukaryotic-like serine/threonine-protein kinase